jgi:hypothetical protein
VAELHQRVFRHLGAGIVGGGLECGQRLGITYGGQHIDPNIALVWTRRLLEFVQHNVRSDLAEPSAEAGQRVLGGIKDVLIVVGFRQPDKRRQLLRACEFL